MNALTPTNNNLVVFYFPGMTSLFQAFVLQKLQKRSEKRLRYGCRRVALHCALKLAKKKNEMKRSSALSALQNGSFRKGTLHFSFFLLPYYLNVLI